MTNAPARPKNPQSKAFDAGIAAAVAWFATQGQTLADYRDAECQSLLQKHGEATVIKDAFTEGFGKGLAAAIAGVQISRGCTSCGGASAAPLTGDSCRGGMSCRGVSHD